MFGGGPWDAEEPKKRRSIARRDREILWIRAGRKCESCDAPLELHAMQVGHKNAASKGGSTTLRNSVALCYGCNKLQGTDSWAVFMKKMGKPGKKTATSPTPEVAAGADVPAATSAEQPPRQAKKARATRKQPRSIIDDIFDGFRL